MAAANTTPAIANGAFIVRLLWVLLLTATPTIITITLSSSLTTALRSSSITCTSSSRHSFIYTKNNWGSRSIHHKDQHISMNVSPTATTTTALFAAKKNKKQNKSSGGGFGSGTTTTTSSSSSTTYGDKTTGGTIGASTSSNAADRVSKLIAKADKTSLEKQWDIFTSMTDLEIKPLGSSEEESYQHFEVVDVFVRSGSTGTATTSTGSTGWFRIGKVCATGPEYGGTTSMEAALSLQKGLILWTSVHMRRELLAGGGGGGKKGSRPSLEVGYISPPIVYMGTETDSSIDPEEAQYVTLVDVKVPVEELGQVPPNTYGFRPDWNPPGFTYKRREKDAMKKKKNKRKTLEDILDE